MIFIFLLLVQKTYGSQTLLSTFDELNTFYSPEDDSPKANRWRQLCSQVRSEAAGLVTKVAELHNELTNQYRARESYLILAKKIDRLNGEVMTKNEKMNSIIEQSAKEIQRLNREVMTKNEKMNSIIEQSAKE